MQKLAMIGALFLGHAKDAQPARADRDHEGKVLRWHFPSSRGRRGHSWPGKGHGTPPRARFVRPSPNPRGRAARRATR
jgi:hypothetical protein